MQIFLISSENMLLSSALDGKDTHSTGGFNGGKEGSLKVKQASHPTDFFFFN